MHPGSWFSVPQLKDMRINTMCSLDLCTHGSHWHSWGGGSGAGGGLYWQLTPTLCFKRRELYGSLYLKPVVWGEDYSLPKSGRLVQNSSPKVRATLIPNPLSPAPRLPGSYLGASGPRCAELGSWQEAALPQGWAKGPRRRPQPNSYVSTSQGTVPISSFILSAVNKNLKGETAVKKYCKTSLTVTPKDVTVLKQLLSFTWG